MLLLFSYNGGVATSEVSAYAFASDAHKQTKTRRRPQLTPTTRRQQSGRKDGK